MKSMLLNLDDALAKELERFPNKSETVREALRLYIQHIDSDKLQGLQTAYKIISKQLHEIESKVDYLARFVK